MALKRKNSPSLIEGDNAPSLENGQILNENQKVNGVNSNEQKKKSQKLKDFMILVLMNQY